MAEKTRKSTAFWLIGCVASLLWAGSVGFVFLSRWSDDLVPVEQVYLARENICKATYGDPAARDRCLVIMDLERFQSRSIMIANRVLICLLPPLIGLGILVYLRRRRSRNRTKRQ